MRKILSLTVACLLTSWMSAQTVANMDSLKAEKKSVATSIKLTGKLTTVGNSDFRQMRDLCWQLRHVDLSASICPSIPKNAFHSRHHLQSIILPANLQSIGSQAFFACDKLQSISLPSQVKQVGKAAFSGCKNLQDITINGTPPLSQASTSANVALSYRREARRHTEKLRDGNFSMASTNRREKFATQPTV